MYKSGLKSTSTQLICNLLGIHPYGRDHMNKTNEWKKRPRNNQVNCSQTQSLWVEIIETASVFSAKISGEYSSVVSENKAVVTPA